MVFSSHGISAVSRTRRSGMASLMEAAVAMAYAPCFPTSLRRQRLCLSICMCMHAHIHIYMSICLCLCICAAGLGSPPQPRASPMYVYVCVYAYVPLASDRLLSLAHLRRRCRRRRRIRIPFTTIDAPRPRHAMAPVELAHAAPRAVVHTVAFGLRRAHRSWAMLTSLTKPAWEAVAKLAQRHLGEPPAG